MFKYFKLKENKSITFQVLGDAAKVCLEEYLMH